MGYDIDEVEEFLEDARRAYSATDAAGEALTSTEIRQTGFTMRRGGYSTVHVDAALERLEDAFAQRERERAVARVGEQEWYGEARATAQALLDRMVRPRAQRFTRVGIFTTGYSVREVDAFADRITQYFQNGSALSIEQIRTVSFNAQRGGYREAQVDYVLETVIKVMLAVR
jgi:DivIVA domain-containing protein